MEEKMKVLVCEATVKVPHGYRNAKEFADDCGLELVASNESPKVVAAAPDMLAALRSLRNEITGVWGAFEHEIRASISNTNYQVMRDKLDAANAAIDKAERDAHRSGTAQK